jgi:hypothetical protein
LAKFIPVDPLYADVNGDNVPDVAIGRLPVRTSADLSLIIGKILAYGSKSYGSTALFASDKTDGVVSYKSISNEMSASLPSNWAVQNIALDDTDVTTAHTQLLAAMNSGTALVTYIGHSGPVTWSATNLFNSTDAAGLTNSGKPFVAVQWGCWNTYYISPTSNYLVQSLLFSGDKGAVAVLGASTLVDSGSEEKLGVLLTPRMAIPGMTIGQALQQAKSILAQTHPEMQDVLLGWTLMGDPALVIAP